MLKGHLHLLEVIGGYNYAYSIRVLILSISRDAPRSNIWSLMIDLMSISIVEVANAVNKFQIILDNTRD